VFGSALADQMGVAELYLPEAAGEWADGWASLMRPESRYASFEVKITTLDEIMISEQTSRVDLIKVDVEGAEPAFLRGAASTLSHHRPAVIFEVNGLDAAEPTMTTEAMDILLALDYQMFGIQLHAKKGPRLHRLIGGDDPRHYREPFNALNLVALHPGQARTTIPELAIA
jgi:hypothetical protein